MIPPVPRSRVRLANEAPVRPDRAYVLYVVTAHRRLVDSHALDFAVLTANELDRPLVVVEPLPLSYPYASERFHAFMMDGMEDSARFARTRGATYLPIVERVSGAAAACVARLASSAAMVVLDDRPERAHAKAVVRAGRAFDARVVAVDANGLLPLSLTEGAFPSAYAFRRVVQRLLPPQLDAFPSRDPLAELRNRATPVLADLGDGVRVASTADRGLLASLPIARTSIVALRGGATEAERTLARFVRDRLPRYLDRAHPDVEASSGLSPYLHFGHVSPHRVFAAIANTPPKLVPNGGKREGYFGFDAPREAFLDQLLVWRELGFSHCRSNPDYDRYESLPEWARRTLDAHRHDPREASYEDEALERGHTDDPLWNAAQHELTQTGVMQNYMRMLWGKKLIAWSASPEDAFRRALWLNDAYALDGRDPNTYASIGWLFGRFDRPWGPESPVFGTIRRMTSASAERKLDLEQYVARHAGGRQLTLA